MAATRHRTSLVARWTAHHDTDWAVDHRASVPACRRSDAPQAVPRQLRTRAACFGAPQHRDDAARLYRPRDARGQRALWRAGSRKPALWGKLMRIPTIISLPLAQWPDANRLAWIEACRPTVRLQRGGRAAHMKAVTQ